jgi:hypothetical protein
VWVVGGGLIVWATLLPGNEIASQQIPPRWCLMCGGLWMTDALSNVALFAPLGIALALRGWRWWIVGAAALGLSVGVETLQSLGFPPARSAALADVITNSLGGLLGAGLVARWDWVVAPSVVVARRLTVAWAAGASAVFGFTTLAVGPRDARVGAAASSAADLSASPYPHIPGQPWSGGILDSAIVGGTYRVRRGSSEPAIVQIGRDVPMLDAEAFVHGRATEPSTVPIVFVHAPSDSAPVLQLRSHGDAAELAVTRRAWAWGLALPPARLADAFRGRTPDDARPLHLVAHVGRDSLVLSARGPGYEGRAVLALAPTLGWAMIQTVVEPSSALAPIVLCCWLAGLVLPIGWWGARSGGGSRWITLAAAGAVAIVLRFLPPITGVAPVSRPQWMVLAVLLAAGAVGSRLLHRGRLPI